MEVVCDFLPEAQRELLLKVVQGGVDGRTWNGEEEQGSNFLQEFSEALIDDGFDNCSVHIGEPNAHKSPNNKENGQNVDVLSFLRSPAGEHFA